MSNLIPRSGFSETVVIDWNYIHIRVEGINKKVAKFYMNKK